MAKDSWAQDTGSMSCEYLVMIDGSCLIIPSSWLDSSGQYMPKLGKSTRLKWHRRPTRTGAVDNAVVPNRVQVGASAKPADLHGVTSLIIFVAARSRVSTRSDRPLRAARCYLMCRG